MVLCNYLYFQSSAYHFVCVCLLVYRILNFFLLFNLVINVCTVLEGGIHVLIFLFANDITATCLQPKKTENYRTRYCNSPEILVEIGMGFNNNMEILECKPLSKFSDKIGMGLSKNIGHSKRKYEYSVL